MSVLHLKRQRDNDKLYYLDKFYISGGKSLVFMFTFPYHSSDDRRLMILILVHLACIVDSSDLAY